MVVIPRAELSLSAAEAGNNGEIVWTIRSPYVVVGGKLEIEGQGAKFSLSRDGKKWQDVDANFDASFAKGTPACYEYRLLVDGQWRDDPQCANRQPNQFGGQNCVLVLRAS